MKLKGFDSILVRLKAARHPAQKTHHRRFDSILVRLKGITSTNALTNSFKFRFHTGSIKRLSDNLENIIRDPLNPCQVNFSLFNFQSWFAVNLWLCKFSGRLTASGGMWVYRYNCLKLACLWSAGNGDFGKVDSKSSIYIFSEDVSTIGLSRDFYLRPWPPYSPIVHRVVGRW